ncbi:hypothetical protein [Xenorhabdus mauleonii]|nr:hypothetical protein [Xenorhabdus mauleonii]
MITTGRSETKLAFGCLWLPLVAFGCLWLPLVAFGCLWLPLVAAY